MEFLSEYGLFLAKTATLVIAIMIIAVFMIGFGQKSRRPDRGHIEVRSLNDNMDNITRTLKHMVQNPSVFKQEQKQHKKNLKQAQKSEKVASKTGGERKSRVYVVEFDGDIQASAVKHLREEVTAILSVADPIDEVVVKIESPGGHVHGYGLAASQLRRIIDKGIPLTVSVDKVAASGGYMMACIANRIIAAPFALLGSIGVIAQIPNFHRFLKNHDVDVEVLTAGEFKRTLTLFGENTEKGREKFLADLEDVHALFKEFVSENRPVVEIDAVSTGEAWYGRRALDRKLVDELKTSDEYLYDKCQDCDVYQVRHVEDKSRLDRILDRTHTMLMRVAGRDKLEAPGPFIY